jgi:hypothetical protein
LQLISPIIVEYLSVTAQTQEQAFGEPAVEGLFEGFVVLDRVGELALD